MNVAAKDRILLVELVIDPSEKVRPHRALRRIPYETCGVEAVAKGEGIRRRVFADECADLLIQSDSPRIVSDYVVDLDAIGSGRPSAQRNVERAGGWIDQQRRVLLDRLPVDHKRISRVGLEEPEYAGSRKVCVDCGNANTLSNGLRKLDALALPAAEEKGPVLFDRPAHLDTEHMHSQIGPLDLRGIVEPFVCVERVVTKELEDIAVELVCAGARCDRDVSAAVAPELGGRVVSYDAILLHVVGIDAVEIRLRVRTRGLVAVDAVDGHVVRPVARAVYMRARAGAVRCSLNESGFEHYERKRVAPVERKIPDGSLADNIAEHGMRRLDSLVC